MSLDIATISEGPDDARVVRALVGRLVADAVEWVREQPELLGWVGCMAGASFTSWAGLECFQLPWRRAVRRTDFSGGIPTSGDGYDARKALLMLDGLGPEARPAAVVLQRDDDRSQTHRRRDLELARDSERWAFAVVVGVAHPMIEAWVLAGFTPDDREWEVHAAVCQHLGFDPCRHGHLLSPNHADHAKRAKSVRERLTGNHWPRELCCLQDADWPTLETNGEHSGLKDFLAEVRKRLIPSAFGTPPP